MQKPKKKEFSDHTPTTRSLGEISKQNRAAYSDREKTVSEEVVLQSHASFCQMMKALTRYQRKQTPEMEHFGVQLLTRANKPCHPGPAGKRAGRGCLPAGELSQRRRVDPVTRITLVRSVRSYVTYRRQN